MRSVCGSTSRLPTSNCNQPQHDMCEEGSGGASDNPNSEPSAVANGQDLPEGVGEPFDPFVCQICLDIAYKPVVLQACGHVFCFWCIRKSMNDAKPSLCPSCREPYLHFPRVCRLLHFLLEKAWPLHYQRKASEIFAMEQSTAVFSPRILPVGLGTPPTGGATDLEEASSSCGDGRKLHVYPDFAMETAEETGKVGVEDVSCAACGKLLHRPVVINCGEAVCERCWEVAQRGVAGSNPECCACGCLHPQLQGPSVRVCLPLHHYLERAFAAPYSQRHAHESNSPPVLPLPGDEKEPTLMGTDMPSVSNYGSGSTELEDDDDDDDDDQGFVHVGVGCDGCGMFPIVSRKRYHCVECGESQVVGYDLCQCCYDIHAKHAREKSPVPPQEPVSTPTAGMLGRFNQPHSPRLHHFLPMQASRHSCTSLTSQFLRARLASAFHLDIDRGAISRRRRAIQVIMDDFDDYIDSFV